MQTGGEFQQKDINHIEGKKIKKPSGIARYEVPDICDSKLF